jgi:hypothetical protein
MQYLYLPTTTLNFNNLLSTGSVSPPALYAVRRFGYKQFDVVAPNPFKNVLLLYDQCPLFAIEDTSRDSHPLVLRVLTERLPKSLTQQNGKNTDVGVFSCAETIYFDPSSADLFFLTAEAKQVTMAKAEPSLTTKLIDVFQPYMRILDRGEVTAFNWTPNVIRDIKDESGASHQTLCEDDNRINRLKGFACGFILGAYKSIDPKVAGVRSKFRSLRNEVSAMLNEPSRQYPVALRKDVEFSCTTLDHFLAEADLGTRRFSLSKGDMVGIAGGVITDVRDHNDIGARNIQSMMQLVNNYCLGSEFSGQLDESRLDVAMAGAKAIRAIIGDQWEGSPYKTYINALLNNIKSSSAFDFNETNSLVMQSFAALVLKGDDLEKLESFLIAQGIGDLRISFGLWGALFGFSKIPKTVYNLPSQLGDGSYSAEMHAFVHSVVHGIPMHQLKRSTPRKPEESVVREAAPPTTPLDWIGRFQQKWPGFSVLVEKLSELIRSSGGLNAKFITLLKKIKAADLGASAKKGITKADVVTFFEETLASQPTQSQPELPRLSSDMPRSPLFWKDVHAWDAISSAVPAKSHILVRDTLQWFQSEWQLPDSKYYGWANSSAKGAVRRKRLDERTNEDAIAAFCSVLKRRTDVGDASLTNVRRLLASRYKK